jgi:hypothetical protein
MAYMRAFSCLASHSRAHWPPLLEIRFFEQVFVDNGAVAWPGEIDLAA